MACILHFFGDSADVDELERICPTEPCAVFRKGKKKPDRLHLPAPDRSGISLVASDADFDQLEVQQAEALAFLKKHRDALYAMRSVSGVETGSIDFGISKRNVVVQGDAFEADLIVEVAYLRMRLVLSQYPVESDEGETSKRQH